MIDTALHTNMMRSIVMEPLASTLAGTTTPIPVILWLNETYRDGLPAAAQQIQAQIPAATISLPYCFATLHPTQIRELASSNRDRHSVPLHQIWIDHDIHTTLTHSLTTVKADAAHHAFHATGNNIVWAVLDSGIDATHPHFALHQNLSVPAPLTHKDFTAADQPEPLTDHAGHGTHVAGILAGEWTSTSPHGDPVLARETRTDNATPDTRFEPLQTISGVAPQCKLVSLKVVGPASAGKVSAVLRAIDQIQQWNQHGRRLLVHGANLSLGYDFDPRWFACGQSPLCVEVNRLVRNGVSVVVSAGNGGYSSFLEASGNPQDRFSDMSITDPGNAELALTAGATHREMPHTYGVSYFSSRGPTGDGRLKPDLLAPGERIVSCAAGRARDRFGASVLYCEQSGTSMAAAHISGAIAAFLSVRPEFIGQPERVKQLFLAAAMDLRRQPHFQGAGLLDLMKVLQTV